MTDILSVGGISSLSLQVEDVQGNEPDVSATCTFSRRDDEIVITIKRTRTNGRTYTQTAHISKDTFSQICEQIGAHDG
jgi:hypothetical protein